jgi:hypothetical protein
VWGQVGALSSLSLSLSSYSAPTVIPSPPRLPPPLLSPHVVVRCPYVVVRCHPHSSSPCRCASWVRIVVVAGACCAPCVVAALLCAVGFVLLLLALVVRRALLLRCCVRSLARGGRSQVVVILS